MTIQPEKFSLAQFSSLVQIAPRAEGVCEIAVGQIPGIQGAFKLSELGMEGVDTEVVELPEEFRVAAPKAPTHLICVKRAEGGGDYGMFFGGEFLIDNVSVLALYRPETQTLECFHCMNCAVIVLEWFKEMQSEWHEVYLRGVDESTGERPQRTQH